MEAAILAYDQSPIDSFSHVVEGGPFNAKNRTVVRKICTAPRFTNAFYGDVYKTNLPGTAVAATWTTKPKQSLSPDPQTNPPFPPNPLTTSQ